MESSNPTLSNKVFSEAKVVGGSGDVMTIQGTVNKTLILLYSIWLVWAVLLWV